MKDNSGLRQIPGVGKVLEMELQNIGINRIDDLKGKDPEKLYRKLCDFKNAVLDRCVLYVFRCAVYYAENENHDPDLLKWWNWKDK
jgi:proteasome assembly chaperone (PAC2) family protein